MSMTQKSLYYDAMKAKLTNGVSLDEVIIRVRLHEQVKFKDVSIYR